MSPPTNAPGDLGCPMIWGPMDGATWRRPVNGDPARVAFVARPVPALARFGVVVHVYESHGAGREWLYLGEIGWDATTPLFDLRAHLSTTAQQDRTEGPE